MKYIVLCTFNITKSKHKLESSSCYWSNTNCFLDGHYWCQLLNVVWSVLHICWFYGNWIKPVKHLSSIQPCVCTCALYLIKCVPVSSDKPPHSAVWTGTLVLWQIPKVCQTYIWLIANIASQCGCWDRLTVGNQKGANMAPCDCFEVTIFSYTGPGHVWPLYLL